MSLAKMQLLVPPPSKPIRNGDGITWATRRTQLGLNPPACLEAFSRLYGSGRFSDGGGELFIYNPFDPAYRGDIQTYCEVYLGNKKYDPEFYPYPCWPEANGLYPIGYGSCGVQFYVIMNQGDASEYSVVFDNRTDGFLEFPKQPIFNFFYDLLCNKIEERPYFTDTIQFHVEPHFEPHCQEE